MNVYEEKGLDSVSLLMESIQKQGLMFKMAIVSQEALTGTKKRSMNKIHEDRLKKEKRGGI